MIANQTTILREKHIMTEEKADTLAKQIYFVVQLIYLDGGIDNSKLNHKIFFKLIKEFIDLSPSSIVLEIIGEMGQLILDGKDYQALALAGNMYDAIGDMQRAREMAQETIERAKHAIELNPNDARALILGAGAWQTLGDKDKAMEWAGRAHELGPGSSGMAYNFACLYAKAGETDRALDFLEKAVELGGRNKRYYETDCDFDSIRDHPRFKVLLKRI